LSPALPAPPRPAEGNPQSLAVALTSSGVWALCARALLTFGGLVATAFAARLVAPGTFGTYITLGSLVLMTGTVGQLGLDVVGVRIPAFHLASDDRATALGAARAVLRVGVVAAAVVGLCTALALYVAHAPLGLPDSHLAVGAVGGWTSAFILRGILAELSRGFHLYAAACLLGCLDTLTLAGCLSLIAALHLHLTLDALLSLTIASYSTVAVVAIYVLSRWRGGRGIHYSALAVLRQSVPLLVSRASFLIIGAGVDTLILAAFRPQRDVALYASATRLAMAVGVPLTIVQTAVSPVLADLHGRRDLIRFALVTRSAGTVAGVPSLAAGVLLVILGRYVLSAVFGGFYAHAFSVLVLLVVAQLAVVATGCAGIALAMTGNQFALMLTTLPAALLAVPLGAVLAHEYGAVGMALATLLVLAAQNVSMTIVCHRRLGFWAFPGLSVAPFPLRTWPTLQRKRNDP
jgi:O-antigen/teichoic acid export membrane protein